MSDQLRENALAALKAVRDPELGVNIVDLGLVYSVQIDEGAKISVEMTMTTPACPMASWLANEAKHALSVALPELEPSVSLVWSPAWTPDRMSDEAKRQLGHSK